MRQRTYLNVILTINAILLSGLLWTQIVSGPAFSSEAAAIQRNSSGIPNAGDQRQQMIRLLEEIDGKVEATNSLLDGEMRVHVTNINEVQVVDTNRPH